MNFEAIAKLINSVGFPIVVSIALFWSNQTAVNANQTMMTEFSNTIANNTSAIQQLTYRIEQQQQFHVKPQSNEKSVSSEGK